MSSADREDIWKLSLASRLHSDYRVPWSMLKGLSVPNSERLLRNLNQRKRERNVDIVLEKGLFVGMVYIHVQYGLGNRLRVLGSALEFANRTGREAVVVWERDVHFGRLFSEVFDAEKVDFAVVDSLQPKWPLSALSKYDSSWKDFVFYNYLVPGEEYKLVVDDKQKNVYFKSSAIMNFKGTSWEGANEQLRRLQVNRKIVNLARLAVRGSFEKVGGVHIRNRGLDEDILGVKDNRGLYSEKDAGLIEKWRKRTKYMTFVKVMRDMLRNGTVDRFFVASDCYEVLGKLEGMFEKGKIIYIERDCDDRGMQCGQYAVADLMVLSKTKVLLGSTWSSFTEAAMRFGGPKALLAGTDFGDVGE